MLARRRGRRWVDFLDRHGDELIRILARDDLARRAAEQILRDAASIVGERGTQHPPVISKTRALCGGTGPAAKWAGTQVG
jgi:hypothetical protein